MTLTIHPAKLGGAVTPPPSKSQAHRLLIAAAMAEGESLIRGLTPSRDIDATRRCLEELGAEFRDTDQGTVVLGMGAGPMSPMGRLALPQMDCGESGSTLRFLIPVALAVRGGGIFTGSGRLMERPMEPYADLFREKGIFFEQKDGTITVQGRLEPGEYRLPGNVSSQFFTGLLFALPVLGGPSAIVPTTPELESMDYIVMTLLAQDRFGIRSMTTMSLPPQYHIPGGQKYVPADVTVEGDWSQGAFWYAARALGSQVEILGLDGESAQGDRIVAHWYERLVRPGEVEIDLSGCPDLAPPLAAMAAVREGTVRLVNGGRLRMKESDRLAAIADVLGRMGAQVTEGEDSLTIVGRAELAGGVTVDAHNDHRIAMMAAVAATACREPVALTGAECVGKSYPGFWKDYAGLGGLTDVREEE